MRSNYRVEERLNPERMAKRYDCWCGSLHLGTFEVDDYEENRGTIWTPFGRTKALDLIESKDAMFADYDGKLKWSD